MRLLGTVVELSMTALRDWTATVRIGAPVSSPSPAEAPEPEPSDTLPRVGAERQRIALALHDEVGPLLFAMSSRVRRALAEDTGAPEAEELRSALRTLAAELMVTQDRLRSVIRGSAPTDPAEAFIAATQRETESFSERTGVPAHLVVRGKATQLPAAVERVALTCLRQALVNVERHARASVVVVTLDHIPDRLDLVVQDDGRGLPAGYEPPAVPVDGRHWGTTSMAEQAERLGGSVLLRKVEEGGTQLRVELPVAR
jgi:signal transduction histidine kinase